MIAHRALSSADAAFAAALSGSSRGPDRDGVFALWLVVRAALTTPAGGGGAGRQADRLKALQRRLKSLNAPAPQRRSLVAALADLAAPRPVAPAIVLSHLVAPAADTVGRSVADAIAAAARAVRAAQQSPTKAA